MELSASAEEGVKIGFPMRVSKMRVLEAALNRTCSSVLIKKTKSSCNILGKNIFARFFGLLSVTGGIKFYLLLCVYVLEKGVGMLMRGPVKMFSKYSNHTQE